MGELEKEVTPYKLPARFAVLGMSKAFEAIGTRGFDKEELDFGTLAGAAKIYEMGGVLTADYLLFMFIATVSIPRFVEWYTKWSKEQKANTPAGIDKLRAEETNKRGLGVVPQMGGT